MPRPDPSDIGSRDAVVQRRRRKARGSLSREAILDAARDLVEADGLRALSMPILAARLESGVTSIYWYFKSKNELVDALAHQVFRDLHQQLPPVGPGSWEQEVFDYFVAFRDLLRKQAAYREIVAYAAASTVQSALTGAAVRRLESGLDLLAKGGLTREQSVDVFGVCLNYTRGFVVLEETHTSIDDAGDDRRGGHGAHQDVVFRLNRLDNEQFRLGLWLMVTGVRGVAAGDVPDCAQ
jgi:AcrR family transcriptional regulator